MARAHVLDGVVAETVDGEVRGAVAERIREGDVDLNGVGERVDLEEAGEHRLLLLRGQMNHENAGSTG